MSKRRVKNILLLFITWIHEPQTEKNVESQKWVFEYFIKHPLDVKNKVRRERVFLGFCGLTDAWNNVLERSLNERTGKKFPLCHQVTTIEFRRGLTKFFFAVANSNIEDLFQKDTIKSEMAQTWAYHKPMVIFSLSSLLNVKVKSHSGAKMRNALGHECTG